MKILGIPKSDKHSASCRIRYYEFLEYLPEGFSASKYKDKLDCDILYVQKIVDDWVLEVVKKAQKVGIPVVYDRDDVRKIWGTPNHFKMIKMADVITTDTEERKVNFEQQTDKPVYVVPDGLDYGVSQKDRIEIRELNRIVTFGNAASIGKSARYINEIKGKKYYITKKKHKELNAKFIQWNRKTFIRNLRKHDVAIIVHDNTEIENMKSNNRLLVCMAIGMPVIVSNTIAYRKTIEDVGLVWLCVDSPREIKLVMKRLRDRDTRIEIGNKFIEYAYDNYSPGKSSKILAEVFEKCIK